MGLARVDTFTLDGVQARRVWVEADVRGSGLPSFTVVGLADKAVREARERVRAAITNSGFVFPDGRITVNLAPAYLRKIGPAFDLPLAIALLAAGSQLATETLAGCAIAGELSLTGDVRAIRGALAMAEGARRHGLPRLLVPRSRAREAALVGGLQVTGVGHLQETVEVLRGDREPAPLPEHVPRARRRGTARAAGPVGRPRPQRADPRARDRRGRGTQPVPPRPARHRQDDARAPAARPAAAAHAARRRSR